MASVTRNRTLQGCCWVAVLGGLLAAPANAADRVVIAEEFTATWCQYCPPVGQALIQMMQDYPDTFIGIQIHDSDTYDTSWGDKRMTYYGVTGFPTVWYDGAISQVGSYGTKSQNYTKMKQFYEDRIDEPTDTWVKLGIEDLGSDKYNVKVRVGIDEGGVSKKVRVQVIQVLANYPSGNHYINCLVASANASGEDVEINAGEFQQLSYEMTLNLGKAGKKRPIEEAKYIVIVHKPETSGKTKKAVAYNAVQMAYPFSDFPPDFETGDVNCSGAIDFDDIDPFVMALSSHDDYVQNFPDCDYMLADVDLSGSVDFNDIDPFIALLSR